MPHVDINMYAGRDDETKKRLADAIAETMIQQLGCDPSHLSVAIYDREPEKWGEFAQTVNEENVVFGKIFKAK